jgi:hypothetical protein
MSTAIGSCQLQRPDPGEKYPKLVLIIPGPVEDLNLLSDMLRATVRTWAAQIGCRTDIMEAPEEGTPPS